jgi:hypothetical protein
VPGRDEDSYFNANEGGDEENNDSLLQELQMSPTYT